MSAAMDTTEAFSLLGVSAADDWATVRAAYRQRIRQAHPDVVTGQAEAAARINAAYTYLARARRTGTAPAAPLPRPTRAPAPPRPRRAIAADVELLGTDTLIMQTPPDETFARLLVALDRLGEITFVDRSCPIVEAVLVLDDGTSHSLVLTIQGRGASTEVFATLEALTTVASRDPSLVLRQLAQFIPER